jgi:transcriptional regulator with XRE-family HTH domain
MKTLPLGEKMRKLRVALGISLREFSRRAELSPSFVSDVEHGRRYPSSPRLKRIAKTLNVPVSRLADLDHRVTMALLRGMLDDDPDWGPVFRRIHAAAANDVLTPAALMKKLPGGK